MIALVALDLVAFAPAQMILESLHQMMIFGNYLGYFVNQLSPMIFLVPQIDHFAVHQIVTLLQ